MAGLWLPDNRLLAPELLVPGRKPVGRVKIDWAHPLSTGLLACPMMRPGELYDPVGLAEWVAAGTPLIAGYEPVNGGIEIALNSGAARYTTQTQVIRDLPTQNEFTVLFHAVDNSISASNPAIGGWSGADDLVFYPAGSTALGLRTFWRDGPNLSDPSQRIYSWHWYGMTSLIDAGTVYVRGYVDGVEINSNSGSASGLGPFSEFQLGSWETQSEPAAWVSAWMFFDRRLSLAEIKSITHDPYQFLVPA